MNIGDLILRLLADGSELTPSVQKEAAKAGDAGAKTLGAKLSGSLKDNGLKAFGAAATATFGLALKGALDLQEVQAHLRAETGASADEAAAAAKAINHAAGTEQASLQSVTDVAIKVRRDLGAIGPEADSLTERFTRFARVTRQDASGAVSAFDDILDKWGLKASDSVGIQDKLLASWQKWGGSIEANQQGLVAIAAPLRALNLTVDDGIALINLFNSAGIDSASSVKALNQAVKNLKPGQTLNDLIKQIASIQDPTERAQAAIKVFGSKGGVELANALHPGITGLDDFKVSATDAAGATDKAADIIDGSIRGRIAKAFSEAKANIRAFGAEFGPAGQALAGFASLVATLGGGKLLKGLASMTLKPLGGLGLRIATKIAEEVGSGGAVNALGGRLGAAIGSLPGVSAVKTGVGKVGSFLGSTMGKAFVGSFVLLIIAQLAVELSKIVQENKDKLNSIGQDVANEITNGTTAQLEVSKAALKTAIDQVAENARGGNVFALDTLKGLVAQYNAVQTELNNRAAANAKAQQYALQGARQGTAQAANDIAQEVPKAFEKNQAFAAARVKAFLKLSIGQQLVAMGPEVLRGAAQLALDVASGLRDRRSAVDAAIAQLKTDIKNGMTPSKEAAHDIGLLFSKTLAHGLHSADPIVKAQAQGTRALIEAELIDTVKAGGTAGKKIQEELERNLKSKDPAVRNQAARTKSLIDAALKAQPAKTPGDVIGDQLNADLKDQHTTLGKTAYDLGRTIARNLVRGVQGSGVYVPSTSATGAGSGGVPHQVGNTFASGTWSVPGDQFAFIHDREIIVPRAESDAIRAGTATLGAAPTSPLIGELHVDARGATKPAATGAAVKQAVGDAMADVLRDQSRRGLMAPSL